MLGLKLNHVSKRGHWRKDVTRSYSYSGIFYNVAWLCFYQTRSAWSMDQGSNKDHSPINNFTPTVTKFCVMWEGQALPHDTKFGNCRDKIVDSRAFLSWSLIHGSSWSRLIKAEPGLQMMLQWRDINGIIVKAINVKMQKSQTRVLRFVYKHSVSESLLLTISMDSFRIPSMKIWRLKFVRF